MAATKDMFVEYLKKIKAVPQLNGVATDGTITLASDGYTALWHTDPLYTSLAPQLEQGMQARMTTIVKQSIREEVLASIAIPSESLKLMSDMLGKKHNHVILQIRKMGSNTVLVAGTRDSGMVIMPCLTGGRSHEMTKKESAPFLFWGLDEGDE